MGMKWVEAMLNYQEGKMGQVLWKVLGWGGQRGGDCLKSISQNYFWYEKEATGFTGILEFWAGGFRVWEAYSIDQCWIDMSEVVLFYI